MAAVSTFPSATEPPTAAHPQQVWRQAERAREIAEEFCNTSSSWKTLPQRLERLARRLEGWGSVSCCVVVSPEEQATWKHVFFSNALGCFFPFRIIGFLLRPYIHHTYTYRMTRPAAAPVKKRRASCACAPLRSIPRVRAAMLSRPPSWRLPNRKSCFSSLNRSFGPP